MSIDYDYDVSEAKNMLKADGYQVYNLWHIEDIHSQMKDNGLEKISDEEAMEILEEIMSSEAVISHINEVISQVIMERFL